MQNNDNDDINKIKRNIVILKREIEQLKFKNSILFKVLNLINMFIFIIYLQFIILYLFDLNSETINNTDIQFKIQASIHQNVKLYTIKIRYKNYFFKSKINKEMNNSVLYSDAIISKDLFFQLPQKLKFKHLNTQWFLVYESLGILTICAIILFTQTIAYIYKQNEHYYPLFSISLLSILSFIGISIFSLVIHKII